MKYCSLTTMLAACMLTTLVAHKTSAQNDAVKNIIEIGKNDNQTMTHLDILTSRFGGRLIGSADYDNAAEWIMQQMKKWGLQCHYEQAGELPVGFNRGPWFGRMIGGEREMPLHFVTPSYTAGTHGVQRGHVLMEPRNEAEFNRMKHALKGAWVLIKGTNRGFPINHTTRGDSLRNEIKTKNAEIEKQNAERRRENKNQELQPTIEEPALFYREMVEAGCLGFIQSAKVPLRALYDRVMLNDPNTTFDNLPTVPDIKLDEHQYALIEQMVKERRDFWLEFDIRNHFKIGPVKYNSVVAAIKGTKYPDEYVIVSGHLDAYDVATGAVDCGTGIAPMMEVARMLALAGAKPKRTILFVAFAGEEFGLLGAHAYVKQHKGQLDKISNMFNRDGTPFPPAGISVPQAMYDDFVKICKPINDIRPDIPFKVSVSPAREKPKQPGGTDATVFAMHGVPTLGFQEVDVKGYNFSYDEIWHTERDMLNKQIPEYLEHTSVVTAIVALGVANLDHQLSREGLYK